jgi:hypothetical protein
VSDRLESTDLVALEGAVERALAGELGDLRILGYGEISCVLAWRRRACKRLPPFDGAERLDSYRHTFETYIGRLRAIGVEVVDTCLQTLERADGRHVAYCVQPILPPDSLLPAWLARADADAALSVFARILEHIHACGRTTRLGLDAQLSNWAVTADATPVYFDLTTPFYRDESGREALDTELFLAAIPAVMRAPVRAFLLRGILDNYYTPRAIILDLLGNLYNQGLEDRLAAWLPHANGAIEPALTAREVRAYHRADARTWALMRRLFRLERLWMQKVRGKPAPLLLPERDRTASSDQSVRS